jgi:SAM-dependent methyltransferase
VWKAVSAAGEFQSGQAPLDLAVATYPAKWEVLRALTSAYIVAALHELGAFARPGATCTPDQLAAQAGIAPGYVGLLERWLSRLAAEGVIAAAPDTQTGDAFTASQPLAAPDLAALRKAAQTQLAGDPMLYEYVERCGPRLAAILTGNAKALETLFPGGSPALAEALYQEWAVSRYYANLMRAVLQGYVGTHANLPLRILEAGAGTGATTGALLPILPAANTVYEFTDVSDLFLSRAATRFAAYPFLRFGRLDLEQPPEDQGYTAGSYHVIVATNVLHATTDLHRTLDYLYGLLAPGGLLLIDEATEHLAWFDITTGLIEGWQRFEDDLRHGQPLLDPATWEQALRQHGFAAVAAWPLAGAPPAVLGQHVIAALKDAAADHSDVSGEDGLARSNGYADASHWQAPMNGGAAAAAAAADPEHGDGERNTVPLLRRLQAAVTDERRELLFDFVCGRIRQVLRLDAETRLEAGHRLLDLGLDSLMALELRRLLGAGIGVAEDALSATLVFDYPTVGGLVEYLDSHIPAELVLEQQVSPSHLHVGAETARAPQDQRVAELSAMSEEEVEALLLEKLNRLG